MKTMPHQINAPSFKDTTQKMQAPFVNEYGVTIGDSLYASEESPLENWSEETDPATMAGDQWVHPTNDIGWNTEENRELLQQQTPPEGPTEHPDHDTGYGSD
nr:DUF3905 domain-containing protein [Fictibacillus macauensis]